MGIAQTVATAAAGGGGIGGNITKIGTEIIDELGDVIEAIITGLSKHSPVKYHYTTTRTTKGGKVKTIEREIELTGLELLLLYVLWRRRENLFPNLDAAWDRLKGGYKWYGERVSGWTEENVLEPFFGGIAPYGGFGPEAARRMGTNVAESSSYYGTGVEDQTTQTGFIWANVGQPDYSEGTLEGVHWNG